MNVYYTLMRKRDANKQEAIFQATKELLNEVGFAEVSMSKIAKRAGVSPATIYVYFQNKDDMLGKLYLDVKKKMSLAIAAPVDASLPIRDIVAGCMRAYLAFITKNREDYLFLEQFSNSPLLKDICFEAELPSFATLLTAIEKGQQEGVLRRVDPQLLMSYCGLPLEQLVKDDERGTRQITEENIQTILEMSWHAIKA